MDLQILPEPSESERQAIVIALRLEADEDNAVSEWSRSALLTVDAQDDIAAGRRTGADS